MKPWTRSTTEEVLASFYLIAAILAWMADLRWLAWVLFVKAGFDSVCAIMAAIIESYREALKTKGGN